MSGHGTGLIAIGLSDGSIQLVSHKALAPGSSIATKAAAPLGASAAVTQSQIQNQATFSLVIEQNKSGHAGATAYVKWNGDGTALASGGEDGSLKIWSRNGQLRSTLVGAPVAGAKPSDAAAATTVTGRPVYGLAWSRDGDSIVYCKGKDLVLKPISPSQKGIQWTAHDGAVLAVDWSPVHNKIVSGGEDGRYKVWDAFGRLSYCSQPYEYPITSVSWSPDGQMFAVGAFQMVVLCDAAGWVHARESLPMVSSFGGKSSGPSSSASSAAALGLSNSGLMNMSSSGAVGSSSSSSYARPTGSIYSISWSSDGSVLAAGTSGGSVLFGRIIQRSLEYKDWKFVQKNTTTVTVLSAATTSGSLSSSQDSQPIAGIAATGPGAGLAPIADLSQIAGVVADVLGTSSSASSGGASSVFGEDLTFRDPILRMSVGHSKLLVATSSQLYVYEVPATRGQTFSSIAPHVIDLPPGNASVPALMVPGPKSFLTVDGTAAAVWAGSAPVATADAASSSATSSIRTSAVGGLSGGSGPGTGGMGVGPGLGANTASAASVLATDAAHGTARLYHYEGRQISTLRLALPSLSAASVSVGAHSIVCVLDRLDSRAVRCIDGATGRNELIRHHMEVLDVAVDPTGSLVAFIDRNQDLYITPVPYKIISQSMQNNPLALFAVPTVSPMVAITKLATMVDSIRWHETHAILCALTDGQYAVWTIPFVVMVDRDLLPLSRLSRDCSAEAGKNATLLSFVASRALCRRTSDGAVLCLTLSQHLQSVVNYALELHSLVSAISNCVVAPAGGSADAKRWESAVRLCRFAKEPALWAGLAVFAMHRGEFNTAEVAYAALRMVDKLQYVQHIKDIPVHEARAAELLLFKRQVDESESMLLQAGLAYRAIKLRLRMFHWERALEIALAKKQHVETVLAHRLRFLQMSAAAAAGGVVTTGASLADESTQEIPSAKETIPSFLQILEQSPGLQISWERVEQLVEEEKEKEQQRPGCRPYV